MLPADPGPYSARVQRRSAPPVVPPQRTFWGRRRWGTPVSGVWSPRLEGRATCQVESKLRRWGSGWHGWRAIRGSLFDLALKGPMAGEPVKRGSTSLRASFLYRRLRSRLLPAQLSTILLRTTVNTTTDGTKNCLARHRQQGPRRADCAFSKVLCARSCPSPWACAPWTSGRPLTVECHCGCHCGLPTRP